MNYGREIIELKDEVLSFKQENRRILLQLNAIEACVGDLKVLVALIGGVGFFLSVVCCWLL